MQFVVPKFIEMETRIAGPLTFKQLLYVGLAGAICFFLYFTTSFSIFLISSIFIGGFGFALAFLRIGGRTLPEILTNFLKFSLSPKIFTWMKKGEPVVFQKMEIKKEKEELPLKIAEKSQLKKLKLKVDTKIR